MAIFSEVNFPSLSSAIEEGNLGGYDDGGRFEEVNNRGGQQYQAGQQDNYKEQKMDNDGFVAISLKFHIALHWANFQEKISFFFEAAMLFMPIFDISIF